MVLGRPSQATHRSTTRSTTRSARGGERLLQARTVSTNEELTCRYLDCSSWRVEPVRVAGLPRAHRSAGASRQPSPARPPAVPGDASRRADAPCRRSGSGHDRRSDRAQGPLTRSALLSHATSVFWSIPSASRACRIVLSLYTLVNTRGCPRQSSQSSRAARGAARLGRGL
jgi:hypothetical protein